ncbi:NET1-associated nuclear protein 1 [Sporothrix curviconia]|uniref:NET1-associated nuclear protein 1 n=1 Tax=Sporothrix curviconia TaxID=1260050 RepID=A0ABP0B7L6_9PEZI
MPSKKAAAAADSQKKRKRDKAEDVARLKKRRGQAAGEETAAEAPQTNGSAGQLAQPKSRAIADRPTTWTLSEPMGGSMSNIDPIFTPDEEHIIIVYRTSIQIYSTADSLLERRIKLPEEDRAVRIVAAALSPKSTELVWIGCTDGALYRANWATGEIERVQRKQEPAPRLAGLTAELVQLGSLSKEVLYLSEGAPGAWSVAAYDATTLAKTAGRVLFTVPSSSSTTAIDLLRTADGGRFVVGASGKTVFVGGLKAADSDSNSSRTPEMLTDLAYQFYSLDAADEVSCLDVRAAVHKKRGVSLDLVIGCVRGAIYVYDDVFSRLQGATAESSRKKKAGMLPRKHHWHSYSVNAVKWSRDGNYFISGGPESVLMVWQVDTGKKDFLPHLSASIENIVVSPRGASYALHLDDNSSMVVSTAEMKPTFYVSGLQTLALAQAPAKDANVRRAYQPIDAITKPIPAAVNPTDASRIWLRVGNGQKASMTGELPSSSLLQTFDVAAFRSVGKQPLARTNPTEAGITRSGMPVTEPTITHLCASHDGQWLASVDEWQPPERDISGIPGEPSLKREWARDRREVHLKFWSVADRSEAAAAGDDSKGASSAAPEQEYELVTRIDEAHFTNKAETIFAVEADTRHGSRFVTLGDDGMVRFWGVKTRVRDGVVAKDDHGRPLVSWQCTQSVPLPLGESDDEANKTASVNNSSSQGSRRSGALAFSEDGSTVFAAFGGPGSDAALYTIDAESGVVRDTLQGMFRGDVRGLAVMGASLVLLSADLRVFDIVADELRYGLRIMENVPAMDVGTALSLTQLAVGRLSNTFVVAVPYKLGEEAAASMSTSTTTTTATASFSPRFASRLAVYSPDHAQPLFTKNLPYLVVSLLPAVGLSGFLAIDAAAQVWSIADAADTTSLGQSLADLNLPTADYTPVERMDNGADEGGEGGEGDEDEDEDEEMQDTNGAATAGGEDDDTYGIEDAHDVVIAPQKLKEIFEAAPATAATSIEELFWQVSGLLSSLPSVVRAG